jgi:hypothetical protein
MTDHGDEHTDRNLITRLQALNLETENDAVAEIIRLEATIGVLRQLAETQTAQIREMSREIHRCRNILPAHIARIMYEGEG